ncbi:MAG: START-like domain-containing protein [Candidatus Karelsulcia muelleri]|nr:MAG: START-like domain-containing protein [Candidatus Karelsulcia muelleri]
MREPIQFEFQLNYSKKMLYNYIYTPEKMAKWFADYVQSIGSRYICFWNGYEETCFLIKKKKEKSVRYKWEKFEETKYYFEFLIQEKLFPKKLYLLITDFVNQNEIEQSKLWWKNKIKLLKKRTES